MAVAQHKVLKGLMGKLPNIVLKAGWDRCLHQAECQRGALIIQFASGLHLRMWIPWMLRVGKVDMKVGLKWPSNAELMLQDLASFGSSCLGAR